MIKTLKIMNLVFFVLMIAINALANTLPLGIGKTGSISDKYPNLFTPAPITFSIWGVIYLLVAFFIIYQFGIFNSQVYANELIDMIGPWFIISCIMNIGWIFSWHYDIIWLSVLFIIGLLISLMIITTNLSPDMFNYVNSTLAKPRFAKICVYAFDVYFGWIIAATMANISVFLTSINWNRFGFSEEIWTLIVLITGAILGMLLIFLTQRYISALSIIWAYCGILIKHISQSGYSGTYPLIITTTIIGILLIFAAGLIKCQEL